MQPDFTSNKNPLQDRNLYIIISVTLIAIMGGQTIAPILPDLTDVFAVSPREIELVMTVFFIPIGIATPILGLLADRIGIRKVLVPSLLLFAIAGGCSSFANNFQDLLQWRFLQGLGAASLDSLALTMIAMLYRGKALTIAMSINASVIGISTAVYPLTGGILGGISWRYPFLLSVVAFPLVMLVLMVLKLPGKPSSQQKTSLKVYLGNTWSSVNNRSVLALLLAVCALFVIQFGAFLTYMPILAGVNLGASGLFNGLLLASMSLSLALVASQLGWLVKKVSEITLIKIAFIIIAIALILTPTINNAMLLIIPGILFGIAQALILPSSQALLAGLAADNARAGFMAVNASVQSLGQALGPFFAGISFGLWGIKGVFWATAGISLLTCGLFSWMLIPKRDKESLELRAKTGVSEPSVTILKRPHSTPVTATSLQTPSAPPEIYHPTYQSPSDFPTILQQLSAKLIHQTTDTIIELSNSSILIHLGKSNDRLSPDVDLSDFPHAAVVSRVHADIRIERDKYYIRDMASANGTYINKYPLLPGNWYQLRSGDRISFGKEDLVAFEFEISPKVSH
ncbi:MAG: hypothetical protein Tsb0014_17520 [Pleurocapsa sp.]